VGMGCDLPEEFRKLEEVEGVLRYHQYAGSNLKAETLHDPLLLFFDDLLTVVE
jgi:hypothetical protein